MTFWRTLRAKRPPYHFQGTALISAERFRRLKLFTWLYALAWAAALLYVSVVASFSMVWRAALWLVLVLGAPSLEDLLMSYAAYKKSWELGNSSSADGPANRDADLRP